MNVLGLSAQADAARERIGGREGKRAIARKAMLALSPSQTLYAGELRGIFSGLHTSFVDALMVHRHLRTGRLDSLEGDVEEPGMMQLGTAAAAIEVHFMIQVPSKVGRAWDRVQPVLRGANARVADYTLRGISSSEQGLSDVLARAREANIQLVEKAGRAYAADVRSIFEDPSNYDLSASELKKLLLERGSVSVSRADLIARDQILKTNSAMTHARMRNAGIDQYEWSGVMDERERESHVDLEGRVFGIDEQTPIGYKPGEDYQCRCLPLALVEGIDY